MSNVANCFEVTSLEMIMKLCACRKDVLQFQRKTLRVQVEFLKNKEEWVRALEFRSQIHECGKEMLGSNIAMIKLFGFFLSQHNGLDRLLSESGKHTSILVDLS